MMWTLVKSYVIFLFLTKGSCTLYFECGIKYRVISSNFVNEDWHIQMWVIFENKLYPTAHILERLSQDLSWLLANWMAPRKLCGAMSKLSHQTLSQYLRFLLSTAYKSLYLIRDGSALGGFFLLSQWSWNLLDWGLRLLRMSVLFFPSEKPDATSTTMPLSTVHSRESNFAAANNRFY